MTAAPNQPAPHQPTPEPSIGTAPRSDRRPDGYRTSPTGGPRVRADVVDLYVFRSAVAGTGSGGGAGGIELLQLLRAKAPMDETWQPVMGHVEPGERAWETAVREAHEEIGLDLAAPPCLGFWALEQVYPYYLPTLDCIVMSPRFVAEVDSGWSPTLNDEHTDHRWIAAPKHAGRPAQDHFMWPGQKRAVQELLSEIATAGSAAREHLRIYI